MHRCDLFVHKMCYIILRAGLTLKGSMKDNCKIFEHT